jgi:hypothetical protein
VRASACRDIFCMPVILPESVRRWRGGDPAGRPGE